MTVAAPTPPSMPPSERARPREGIVAWLTATDHKHVGLLYMTTSFAFFLIGGVLALFIRAQLWGPDQHIATGDVYAQLFTLHGTAMIFLVIAPFGLGLANYLVPLQIGAPDMAFPRMNALSYWLFAAGGLVVFSGVFATGGAAAAGWTAYAPLSDIAIGSGDGMDLWIVGILLTAAATLMTAINLMVTTLVYRAPGMVMWRLPIFTWEMLATGVLILMAFPSLVAVLGMLLLDRRFGAHFFDVAGGGSAILYQHLFWFFGHPEVYVMILPYFGIISEVVPVFSRKPIFGYTGLVLSSFAIAALSMAVWAHHMFTTGAVDNPFFSAMSFLIAVPTGIKFFNWIGTMWRGQLTFSTPMLFAIGFMLNFLIGGVTGVMLASPPIDFQVEDSYFLVAHLHYVLMGGSTFALFAALHFWFPKCYGVRLRESLGRWCFWLMFAGANLTFFPMHLLGVLGMPRRVATYPAIPEWIVANRLESIGSAVLAFGVLAFVVNVIVSLRDRRAAGDDPWGGYSLEWTTASPPPEFNFTSIPTIRSERPAYDWRRAAMS